MLASVAVRAAKLLAVVLATGDDPPGRVRALCDGRAGGRDSRDKSQAGR